MGIVRKLPCGRYPLAGEPRERSTSDHDWSCTALATLQQALHCLKSSTSSHNLGLLCLLKKLEGRNFGRNGYTMCLLCQIKSTSAESQCKLQPISQSSLVLQTTEDQSKPVVQTYRMVSNKGQMNRRANKLTKAH
eukprot:2135949-Amphidinium_carterae.1